MVKVLISDRIEIDKLVLGPDFETDYLPEMKRDELLDRIGSYEVLIVRSRTRVDREVLERGSRLKLVARPGTGLDNIDVEYAKGKGVSVVNSPESLVEAVSEHVILLMLALGRRLVKAHETTKGGKWEKSSLVGTELKGKALGIVGLGRIGRRIAEIARTLGMEVMIYDVIKIPAEVLADLKARVVTLDELFLSSDFVTLHVPMTESTRHLVDRARLGQMKKGGFLINTSRGGVVDEAALASALSSGTIAGAALDVFEEEPPKGAILDAPNTILTPHIGGQTEEAQTDAVAVVGRKIRSFFEKP